MVSILLYYLFHIYMQNAIRKHFSTAIKKEFKLLKFDPQSKSDYKLFRDLMLGNIRYSALQFMIPNLTKEVDLEDRDAVEKYFKDPVKDLYLQEAYKYVTNNHERTKLGYCKVLDKDDQFVGNAGWIMHDVDLDGTVQQLERGIHLNQTHRSSDISKALKPSPNTGAKVMKLVVENLEDYKETLNPDGKLISSILETNKRSQGFTQKHKLNVGKPDYIENGTCKWVQRIGDFVERIPEIKNKLNETINKGKGFNEGI